MGVAVRAAARHVAALSTESCVEEIGELDTFTDRVCRRQAVRPSRSFLSPHAGSG